MSKTVASPHCLVNTPEQNLQGTQISLLETRGKSHSDAPMDPVLRADGRARHTNETGFKIEVVGASSLTPLWEF